MKTVFSRFLLIAFCTLFGFGMTKAAEVEINIIHINDSHSNLLPGGGRYQNLKGIHGGIARAVSVIGEAKMQDEETLLLHSGDIFVGDLMWYLYYGIPELGILKNMGLDAVTIGNHEFDGGTSNLLAILINAEANIGGIDFLSANIVANEEFQIGTELKGYVKDHIIKDVKGVKVGIFGMTTAAANMTSLPGPEVYLDENYVLIANEQVALLKAQGCDIIIFLSHLGFKADVFVAEQTKGINLIVGGHDHMVINEAIEVPYDIEHSTYIVQAGAFYQSIGKVTILVDNGSFVGIENAVIDLVPEIPEEENTASLLDMLVEDQPDDVKMLFNTQLSTCTETLNEKVDMFSSSPIRSSDVGCLISSAFQHWGETDIGFTTSGLSAQALFAGPLVGNDIIRMLGYGVNEFDGVGYNMVKFNIKGEHLYQGVLFTLYQSLMDGDDEFFPQVSGMEIKYGPPFDDLYLNILINGEPIDFEKYYSMTTTIFVASILTSFLELPVTDFELFSEMTDVRILIGFAMMMPSISPDLVGCNNVVSVRDVPMVIEKDVTFFPNPASDLVNINVASAMSGNYDVTFYDYKGMQSFPAGNYFLDGSINSIDISTVTLPSGAYFVKISNGKTNHIGKVIIAR